MFCTWNNFVFFRISICVWTLWTFYASEYLGRIFGRIYITKRETESLLITAQNKAIRINFIKGRIDKTQQNSRCRLCVDRKETINHISKCSKLAQKENITRHDWVGKVILKELCEKLKFNHTNKCYMHSLKFFLENEMHKVLLDFEIQTDHLISARRPDLILVNKKKKKKKKKKKENLPNCGLCCPGLPQSKIERKWKER